MSMKITDDCINCGACAAECPVEAIYEPGESKMIDDKKIEVHSTEHYIIVNDICDECSEINELKCKAVCPMDAIINA